MVDENGVFVPDDLTPQPPKLATYSEPSSQPVNTFGPPPRRALNLSVPADRNDAEPSWVQGALFREDSFGPDHLRIHFLADLPSNIMEMNTIRLGTKWCDTDLVGFPIEVFTGPTKATSQLFGGYIVESILVSKLGSLPASVYAKMTGGCKRNPVFTMDYLRKSCYGKSDEEITANTVVTVLKLVKVKP